MEIEYTARFLKDLKDINIARGKKDTDKVISLIKQAPDWQTLNKVLDIKKYNEGLGGYRIRYSNKPEFRIRFDLVDSDDKKTKKILLQIVLPREKYEKYAHRSINESTQERRMKIIISEAQYKMITEHYDADKLYSREAIVNKLKKGPKELKHHIKTLPHIELEDGKGNKVIGTRIPEVVYIYISGRY
jgi:uncharacterized protein YlaN (UPF0358 family)